jgi:hypothetical protein
VQLIFSRRVTRRTPGQFRTRVITEGVKPSIHYDYKNCRIKQYFKENRALRTETVINNTYDFGIRKRLHNLSALRQVGFQANRQLLNVQMTSHDCAIGDQVFQQMQQPIEVDGQRASGLRFGDMRVQTLLTALATLMCIPGGFRNRDLRSVLAPILAHSRSITPGQMSYELRRLRLHGLIERVPKSHCYQVTAFGIQVTLFYTRVYNRVLGAGLAKIIGPDGPANSNLTKAIRRVTTSIEQWCDMAQFAS